MLMNKRGLSPVIATILLISLAVVMALLIFLWAKGTLAERYLKFNEPVERSCESAVFDVEIVGNVISVVNKGNVPLYGFELLLKESASISNLTNFYCKDKHNFPVTIKNGESCQQTLYGLQQGSNVIVVPIILSQRGTEYVPFMCDNALGKTIVVK